MGPRRARWLFGIALAWLVVLGGRTLLAFI